MNLQIGAVLVCGTLVLPLTLYVIMQRPSYYQNMLTICLTSLFVWSCGYYLELEGLAKGSFETALLGTRVGYIGKPFTLLTMFFFLARYSGLSVPHWLSFLLVLFHTVISACAFGCNYTTLYYSSIGFDEVNRCLVLGKGVLYITLICVTMLYLALDLLFLIISVRKARNSSDRIRSLLIFALMFSGLMGFFIYLSGITNGFDTTLLGCFFSAFCLFLLFHRYRLFDSMTLATEKLLDESSNGYIVENAYNRVEYRNSAAAALLPNLSGRDNSSLKLIRELEKENKPLLVNQKAYKVSSQAVVKKGIFYGRVYELTDNTESYRVTRHLEEEIEVKNRSMSSMQTRIIESLADIVEARDDNTGEHIHNCTGCVRLLAREMLKRNLCPPGTPENFPDALALVAPLHDLGKVTIPDAILKKAAKLTQEEFEIIKTHTVKGDGLIRKTFADVENEEYVALARQVAHYHHERWDGNGYPEGLSGDAIPFSAQVMSICDVYDALRSQRPYKEAYSKEESLKIIASERGKQFNPVLVDVFLAISDEFM